MALTVPAPGFGVESVRHIPVRHDRRTELPPAMMFFISLAAPKWDSLLMPNSAEFLCAAAASWRTPIISRSGSTL